MEYLSYLMDLVLHLDKHLQTYGTAMGPWMYVVLFAIVFCETGLVVTPFLPGDSLLFAVGALAATEGSPIDVVSVTLLLLVAAVLGDAVNYSIGKFLGPKVFTRDSRFLKREHLERTQRFYEKHGGKTIILARFIPIVRTFAPFVAGIGRMEYRRFALFNVTGAIAWVVGFVAAGNFFGNLPIVKRNFHYVILAIIVLSVLPAVFEWWRARREEPPSGPLGGQRAETAEQRARREEDHERV
jgi:membrane-associated protein